MSIKKKPYQRGGKLFGVFSIYFEQAISFSFFLFYFLFLIDSIMLLHNELSQLFHQICYYTFLVLRNRKPSLLTK